MDKDITVTIVLSVMVVALSFLGNQMLMGSFVFLIIVATEIAYRGYLKYVKKTYEKK